MNLPQKVKEKLRNIPDEPGCYMMRDRRGRIIYVGKAASLKKRVRSYFREAALRSAPPKLRGLIKSTHDLDFLVLRNEAEAILTEGRLIKDFKPRYNVSFRDDKRFLLLRAVPEEPFPWFKLCRIKRDDGAHYFGPYALAAAARTTLDFVEKRFGLRKCTLRIPDEETYRHCNNDVVRYCSAPCIGKTTREAYRVRFEEACAFLRGDRPEYLKELRKEMEDASADFEFERAAALRDTLFSLQATVKERARVASTPEMKKEDGKAGVAGLKTVLGLPGVPHVIEAYDVSNISGTYAVASMVCFLDGLPQRARYRRFRIKTVQGSNDPGMIAEAIRRRFARLIKEGRSFPGLVLVDGGITQLRAARTELKKLDLEDVPSAALAKRYEDIYWNRKGPPIRLPKDSPALRVLQRIRDEAHRFALLYHRRLRSKRIRESVLDDVSGIGPKKKQALLQRFGSVYRLARASEDEIAKVAGIGYKTARLILHALEE